MNEIQRRKKEANYLLWIAKIVNEDVTNANVKNVTIVDARLSNDGSDLKVYVLFAKNEKKSLESLNNIKGFIRKELAKYDHNALKIPNLTFKIDEVFKQSARIEQLLNQIKKEEKEQKEKSEEDE